MLRGLGFALLFIGIVCLHSAHGQGQNVNGAEQKVDTSAHREVVVGPIYIIGNKITRKEIILRELNFDEGDRLKLSDLRAFAERDEQKIFNLRLFNSASIVLAEQQSDTVDVVIQVTERWYTFPIPLFKLTDRNFNDWWINRDGDLSRVNYGMKLYQYNMRGRNERLRIIAQTGFTNEYELNYRIPYISRKQKEGLTVNIFYRDRKNLAYNTEDHLPTFTNSEQVINKNFSAFTSYSFRASFYSFHYVTLGYTSLSISDSIRLLNPNYLSGDKLSNRYMTLGYMFVRDLRDFVNYPLNGFYLMVRTRKLGLGFNEDVDMWRTTVQYSKYFDMGKNWYFSATATGNISLPLDQPYFLYEGLGFDQNVIRGYELDVIEGPRYLIVKTNLKKQLIKQELVLPWINFEQFKTVPIAIYGKLFFDAGRVDNYPLYNEMGMNTRLSDRILYGMGGGVDIVSFYDFVVRPEFSINSEGKTNFFLNFKVDF